ncbi:MAG: acetamidase/formamidase family protein [Chloroflexi bacterium]|nr:MAG: acetamidase/formamidase family protein [Chloroflexota bacterium]
MVRDPEACDTQRVFASPPQRQITERRIRVDRSKRLAEQPEVGHNRWHPDIPAIARVRPGERIVLECRDAIDGQITAATRPADLSQVNLNVAHALTGPIHIEGAEPGDLLEVRIVDVEPDSVGFTWFTPSFGFLRDHFKEPAVFTWRIADGYAECADIPGVRIRGNPFSGTIGVAPSRAQLTRIIAREQRLLERGGVVLPPEPHDAVPADPKIANEALRTIPPRENAGNLDVRQLSKGARLYVPVNVEGALFSIGDGHFAQGDGEVCGTAIEMRAAFDLEFQVAKGEATRRRLTGASYSREKPAAADLAAAGPFFATTGISVTESGENTSEDASLAAKRAMLAMIDHLVGDRGFSRAQAYAITSVAVDLRLSSVVNVPNFVASALLPLDIFV